ncbi:unnamed protein product (macronuclear) [Paramecium tetraurelia]|uniref:Uncharacterized protein n=1 Tax=Paramecium tetraurelia TaxID=5888 RepID=A0DWK1_PARTE|nr:uncharacterized protein GSPATT00021061001 [Paramecium tetraurelia]CAK87418.1 unnamed protein product [Paramecium tetraurelia]|eukprot:XP_001454815.1 hypothetical protein (macronuclear) [Paramecium tetraurelia strain d4-2]
MELLRDSIKLQEENKMMKKLALLQQQVGYPLDTLMKDEFIHKLPEESFIWTIISKKYELLTGERANKEMIIQEELYKKITYEMFVDECFQAILHFHLVITDYKFNLHIIQDSIRILKQQISLLESHNQLKFDQPNRLSISYTRHKSLKTDIFNHYQIKYRAYLNGQEQKSIYARGDELICSFPILEESQTLTIAVFGKRKETGTEFKVLSKIELDLNEVLISFPLQSYSKETIQPCLLTLDYQDESLDAPFHGKNPIELYFSLSMPSEQRIQTMKILKLRQEEFGNQIRQEIEGRNSYIQSIIQPFNDLVYIPGENLKIKNEVDQQRFSCSACQIF